MDEVLLKRLVGVVALILAALLFTSILPEPGSRPAGGERVVTIDLTEPDSLPVEQGTAADAEQRTQDPADPTQAQARIADAAAVESMVEAQSHGPVPAAEPADTTPVPTPPGQPVAPAPAAAPDPVPAPASRPAPSPSKAAPVSPAAPKPPVIADSSGSPKPAPTGRGRWQVQAGAYSQLERAETVRAKARAVGVPCILSPAETSQGTMYRVRCGPYTSREQGEAAAALLGKAGIKSQVVGAGS
jgi:DedD protein